MALVIVLSQLCIVRKTMVARNDAHPITEPRNSKIFVNDLSYNRTSFRGRGWELIVKLKKI